MKVFIENEAWSSNKNIYDEKTLEYKKTVKVSREYPYPYGFFLDTTSEDWDNVDCFVITNQRLKSGDIVECEVVALMEQRETSWDPIKSHIEEEDHNVLAVLKTEHIVVDETIKKNLTDFISHVFDHIPNKKVQVWAFLSKEAAIQYIQKSMDHVS